VTPNFPTLSDEASAPDSVMGVSGTLRRSLDMILFLITLTSDPVSTSALSGKLFPLTLKRIETNKVGGRSLDTWLQAVPLMPGHCACRE
jgi:hypothetical protein